MIGWVAMVFSIQQWLQETPESKKKASTPSYFSVFMSGELLDNVQSPCRSRLTTICSPGPCDCKSRKSNYMVLCKLGSLLKLTSMTVLYDTFLAACQSLTRISYRGPVAYSGPLIRGLCLIPTVQSELDSLREDGRRRLQGIGILAEH